LQNCPSPDNQFVHQFVHKANIIWSPHSFFGMLTPHHAKRMKAIELLSDETTGAPRKSGLELNIVGVYQNALTHSWGCPCAVWRRNWPERVAVRSTRYDVHSLSDHQILLAAVRAALVADVIVVSVYAADELPLDLYVWINAWLPARNAREGAFTALLGADKPQDSQSVRTHDYLQAVARKGRLDLIPLLQPVAIGRF
jgi:hypothetical protein